MSRDNCVPLRFSWIGPVWSQKACEQWPDPRSRDEAWVGVAESVVSWRRQKAPPLACFGRLRTSFLVFPTTPHVGFSSCYPAASQLITMKYSVFRCESWLAWFLLRWCVKWREMHWEHENRFQNKRWHMHASGLTMMQILYAILTSPPSALEWWSHEITLSATIYGIPLSPLDQIPILNNADYPKKVLFSGSRRRPLSHQNACKCLSTICERGLCKHGLDEALGNLMNAWLTLTRIKCLESLAHCDMHWWSKSSFQP